MTDETPPVLPADAEPPPLADTLDAVEQFYTRYVAFPDAAQPVALTLWAAHTHAIEHAEVTPYLAITSPEKESGKTRLFEVAELLVARPWRAQSVSEAALFRRIEQEKPTLLLDEVDAIFNPRTAGHYEGLRGLLNAGNRRGSSVARVVGEGSSMEVRDFEVFCAKAVAGIGRMPDTIESRAVPIRLQRRAPGQVVGRFRYRLASAEAAPLRDRLAAWAATADLPLETDVPDALGDRAADAWEPLLVIADAAGGAWPDRARWAALQLHGARHADDDSLGVRLLADCRQVFDEQRADVLFTRDLLAALQLIEDAPWGSWDPPRTAHRLAGLLQPYGVRAQSMPVRDGDQVARGYRRADFEDAWARYLPPPLSHNGGQTVTPLQTPADCNGVTDHPPSHERGGETDPDDTIEI